MPLRIPHVRAFALVALLALAGCARDRDDFGAFPLEGSWADQGDPAHGLEVFQGDYRDAIAGEVTGVESFGPNGPTHAFEGSFFEREMNITIERPDGPRAFKGELLEDDLLLVTSPVGDAYIFVRRPSGRW